MDVQLKKQDFEAFDYHECDISKKYDDLARVYDDVLTTVGWPDPEKTAEHVIAIGLAPESSVLDMGCGTGLVAHHLSTMSAV